LIYSYVTISMLIFNKKNVSLCVHVHGDLDVARIDEWQQIIWASRYKVGTVLLADTSVLHIRHGWCFFYVMEGVNTKGYKCFVSVDQLS
jgi:hypothetical protein